MEKDLIIRLITLITLIGLMTSCSDSDGVEPAGRQGSTMELIPMANSFLESRPWGTRAGYLPDGYTPYNQLDPAPNPDRTTIGIFLTPERKNTIGNFIYQGTDPDTGLPTNDWQSTITVVKDTHYYLYGFMPREDAESATIAPLPGADTSGEDQGFADGAVITLHDFNTITPADVCVIVGARLGTETEKINGLAEDLKLGKFDYIGQEEGANRVFILLKHIYAGLHFKAHINSDYRKLRTIKFTQVQLEAIDVPPTVDLNITITANDSGEDPLTSVTYTTTPPFDNIVTTLFPYEGSPAEYEVPVSTPISFLGCFAPGNCRSFILKSTYNVYDTKGNLIREGCYAENKINSSLIPRLEQLDAGDIATLDIEINPTYLYVLADPDLDNPTFTITTP